MYKSFIVELIKNALMLEVKNDISINSDIIFINLENGTKAKIEFNEI